VRFPAVEGANQLAFSTLPDYPELSCFALGLGRVADTRHYSISWGDRSSLTKPRLSLLEQIEVGGIAP
jgi:hypothetical protein